MTPRKHNFHPLFFTNQVANESHNPSDVEKESSRYYDISQSYLKTGLAWRVPREFSPGTPVLSKGRVELGNG